LYKSITNNEGEPFVPLVELAKIFYKDNIYYKNFHFEDGFGAISRSKDGFVSFTFNEKKGNFEVHINGNDDNYFDSYEYDILTIELLDKLNEWKIDCRNLIAYGLSIDANTLAKNPYK
jgi:hypothetical protein